MSCQSAPARFTSVQVVAAAGLHLFTATTTHTEKRRRCVRVPF
ncbi:unnamed protein product, partial [Staurois parvus]